MCEWFSAGAVRETRQPCLMRACLSVCAEVTAHCLKCKCALQARTQHLRPCCRSSCLCYMVAAG